MYRLRFAQPTPLHVERDRTFTVKLQLCQENGACAA
eukprot:SAG31_NODE_19460_length_600_cov_0.846614_1_plen_35_part_01